MNVFLLCLSLLFLIGCGKGENHPAAHRAVYPPLTESPPPLLPPDPNPSEDLAQESASQEIPSTVVEDGWMEKHLRKEALIKNLREQRVKDPNDPFALTEEAIEELSKIDDPTIQ